MVPHKWHTPEESEFNKRIIDGKPHTFDPNGGFSGNGRWILDDTPTSGETQVPAPASSAAHTQIPTLVPNDEASITSGSLGSLTAALNENSDLALRKYHAHLLIQKLTSVVEEK